MFCHCFVQPTCPSHHVTENQEYHDLATGSLRMDTALWEANSICNIEIPEGPGVNGGRCHKDYGKFTLACCRSP